MKVWFLIFFIVGGNLACSAQTAAQIQQCQSTMDKDIDASLAPAICSTIINHLARGERLVRVSHDGDFTTVLHGNTKEKWMPGRLQSTVFLDTMRMYYGELEKLAMKSPQMGIYATPEETDFILNLWPTARNGFCRYHPGETYLELSNIEAVCPGNAQLSNGVASLDGTGSPKMRDEQSSVGMCRAPVTLKEAEKNGGSPYECRLFSYPNF